MSDQEFQDYYDTRYKSLVKFYDDKAIKNKLWHRLSSAYVIIVSAVLAPLIGTGFLSAHKMCGGLLSATIVVATALASHFQFNENWLSYRATWDALQREPHLRVAGLGDYSLEGDRNAHFVERVEALASSEGAQWFARHSQKTKEKRDDTQPRSE